MEINCILKSFKKFYLVIFMNERPRKVSVLKMFWPDIRTAKLLNGRTAKLLNNTQMTYKVITLW